MSERSLRRAADNRADTQLRLISAERSLRAKVRRSAEWVMSESKHLDDDALIVLAGQLQGLAREWNDRSRP